RDRVRAWLAHAPGGRSEIVVAAGWLPIAGLGVDPDHDLVGRDARLRLQVRDIRGDRGAVVVALLTVTAVHDVGHVGVLVGADVVVHGGVGVPGEQRRVPGRRRDRV